MDDERRRTLAGGLARSQDAPDANLHTTGLDIDRLHTVELLKHRFRSWQPGDVIDSRFEIQRTLGQGGFGQVLAAYDRRMQRDVAIKTLRADRSAELHYAKRFAREIKLVSGLKHPNTVRVFDTGVARDETPYLVMELLEGESLEAAIARRGPFSVLSVARIAVQVLKSLLEAHARGIIHRDLKPGNIFLVDVPGEPDFVKVLDFGIAKAIGGGDETLTGDGQPGTGRYMSPERLRGTLLPSTDIYSLGVVMIELLEGRHPYEGREGPAELHHLELREPVPMRSAAATALAPIITRAVEKIARRRYPSAQEMLTALERVLPGLPPDRESAETLPLDREPRVSFPTARERSPAPGTEGPKPDPFDGHVPLLLDGHAIKSALSKSRPSRTENATAAPVDAQAQAGINAETSHQAVPGSTHTDVQALAAPNADPPSPNAAQHTANRSSDPLLRRLVFVLGGALLIVLLILVWALASVT